MVVVVEEVVDDSILKIDIYDNLKNMFNEYF